MPYARLDPTPTAGNRIIEAYVDSELGNEAFTYQLASGDEGSVHIDAVLDFNEDPGHLAELALYRLTLEAQQRFDESGLSMREAASRLHTSPTQVYRLLDPTNYSKSARQWVALLQLVGLEVHADEPVGPSALTA